MELSLLHALLKALGLEANIDTMSDRKTIQKAVYLAQRKGADLGYRFGWYIKGPYSSSLADAYYRLNKNKVPEPSLELSDESLKMLDPIRSILEPPKDVPLEQPEWMELLASLDYLEKVSGKNPTEARKSLKELKPALADYEAQARTALEKAQLF